MKKEMKVEKKERPIEEIAAEFGINTDGYSKKELEKLKKDLDEQKGLVEEGLASKTGYYCAEMFFRVNPEAIPCNSDALMEELNEIIPKDTKNLLTFRVRPATDNEIEEWTDFAEEKGN